LAPALTCRKLKYRC